MRGSPCPRETRVIGEHPAIADKITIVQSVVTKYVVVTVPAVVAATQHFYGHGFGGEELLAALAPREAAKAPGAKEPDNHALAVRTEAVEKQAKQLQQAVEELQGIVSAFGPGMEEPEALEGFHDTHIEGSITHSTEEAGAEAPAPAPDQGSSDSALAHWQAHFEQLLHRYTSAELSDYLVSLDAALDKGGPIGWSQRQATYIQIAVGEAIDWLLDHKEATDEQLQSMLAELDSKVLATLHQKDAG